MRRVHSRFKAGHRLGFALALLAALMAASAGAMAGVASAASPSPVAIVVDSVTSVTPDRTPPAGTPTGAVPYVLVQIGDTVRVQVSFHDVSGAPAAFSKDTPLAITSNSGGLTQLTGTA